MYLHSYSMGVVSGGVARAKCFNQKSSSSLGFNVWVE